MTELESVELEVLKVAVAAMRSETLKKVVNRAIPSKVIYSDEYCSEWACPACMAEFEEYSGSYDFMFCPYCGQAWDRSIPESTEEEDE